MPPSSSMWAFALTAFAIIVVPGPSVMFVVSRGVSLGRRAALGTVVGNAAGVYVQVVLVAAGLGAVVARSAAVFTAVKMVGAAYLVVLGLQTIRRRGELPAALDDRPASARRVLREGFVVGLANPKVIVFFAAILPQFVDVDGAPAVVQMLVLGLIFVAIALVSDSVWALVAGSVRDRLARHPQRLGWLGAAGGSVIVALGLRLAFDVRSDR